MPTHKERMLAAMRGEVLDVIPFVPRLDLCKWVNGVNGVNGHRFLTGDGTAGLIDLVALRMMISESE